MALLRHLLFFCLVLGLAGGVAQAADQPAANKPAANKPVAGKPAEKPPVVVNFGSSENVLELKGALSPYRAPGGGTEADGSSWYIVQVTNDSVRPATRVLMAGQPPRAALSVIPRRTRPAILALASSDSGTTVETAIRVLSRWGREGVLVTGEKRFVLPSKEGLRRAIDAEDAP